MAWNRGFKVAAVILAFGGMPVGYGASSATSSTEALGNVSRGTLAYRKADFNQAESLYRQALSIDPRCARALLGLGMIEDLHFRRGAARAYFAEAYRVAPNDPQVIRYYASAVGNREAETALLRKYVATGGEDPANVEVAMGRIQLNERLAGREIGILDSPYREYSLPMKPYCPTALPAGMLLSVTINDAKPLRLLFDTGAEGVVIRRRAAERLGLEYLGTKEFRGLGRGEPVKGSVALARSLSIGELRIRNSLVDVSDSLPGGADGVIGPALLQRFLIRFSAAQGRLDLTPFHEEPRATMENPWQASNRNMTREMEGFAKAVQVGHLLLVQARIDDKPAGYFLLDTGAAFSLVSRNLGIPGHNDSRSILGLSGRSGGERTSPVRIQFAREPLVETNAIIYDLRETSNEAGMDISGLIGYKALSQKVLTINYRDGLVGTASHRAGN